MKEKVTNILGIIVFYSLVPAIGIVYLIWDSCKPKRSKKIAESVRHKKIETSYPVNPCKNESEFWDHIRTLRDNENFYPLTKEIREKVHEN